MKVCIDRDEAVKRVCKDRVLELVCGQILLHLENCGNLHLSVEKAAGDDDRLIETACKLQGVSLMLRDIAFELGHSGGFRPEALRVRLLGELAALRGQAQRAMEEAQADEPA